MTLLWEEDSISGVVFVVAVILFVGAFLQGVTGFGFGMVTMALMPCVMGARTSSIVVVFLASMNAVYLSWRLRRWVDWGILAPLFAGAAVGVPLGVHALRVLPEFALKRLIGLTLLLYCAYRGWRMFRGERIERSLPAWTRFPVGLVAGVLGGTANMGGPPVILYVYSQPWTRELIRTTLVTYFAGATLMKIVLLVVHGMVNVSHLGILLAMPIVWVGSRLGLWVGGRLKPRPFEIFTVGVLSLLAGILVVQG